MQLALLRLLTPNLPVRVFHLHSFASGDEIRVGVLDQRHLLEPSLYFAGTRGRTHPPFPSGTGADRREPPMSFKWLQAQLGHSDLKTTMDPYGHFEAATKKAVATSLEGAFQL